MRAVNLFCLFLRLKLVKKNKIIYNIRIMFRNELKNVPVYVPGKPIEEVVKEYNLDKDKVIKLASNENPLGASRYALEAIKNSLENIRLYPESDSIDLRKVLAKHLSLKEDEIIIGRGSDEVIQMLSKATLNGEDEIIVSDPTFSVYEITATIMGAKTVKVPLKNDFTQDLEKIAKKISDKTKIIYLTNPHNPTGSINNIAEMKEFLSKIPQNIIVAMDEAYAEYVESTDYPCSLDFLALGYKNIVGLRTFSKIYGLAGLRVGYGFTTNNDIMNALYKVKEPFNISNIGQAAAIASILDEEQVIKSKLINSEGKIYLTQELKKLGFMPHSTQSNFILVNIFRPVKPLIEALQRRGVIVRNCNSFGLDTCFRVTISTYSQNKQFIDELADAIHKGEW